jgi:CHAT domain-containing protein
MNKVSQARTAIEFIGFNCLLFLIGKFMGLHKNEVHANMSAQLAYTSIGFFVPNMCLTTFFAAIYSLHKFFKKSISHFLERIFVYAITSFLLSGILSLPATFFEAPYTGGSTLYAGGIKVCLNLIMHYFYKFLAGEESFLSFIIAFCGAGTLLILLSFIPLVLITRGTVQLFLYAQSRKFKKKRKLSLIAFVLMYIEAGVSIVLLSCATVFCLYISFTLVQILLIDAITLPHYFTFTFIMLAWFSSSTLVFVIIALNTGVVLSPSLLSDSPWKSKKSHDFRWKFLFPFLEFLQLKIVPLTIFNPISVHSHSMILSSFVFFQERSLFVIDDIRIVRKIADFTLLYAASNQKLIFAGNKLAFFTNKLVSLKTLARQMILMGNIEQAEQLYSKILDLIEYQYIHIKPGILDNKASAQETLNTAFKELFEFYVRLNQKEKAKIIYLKTDEYLQEGKLSLITALFIQMEYDFHFGGANAAIELGKYSSRIGSNNLPDLILYLIRYSPNSWKVSRPQDLNKLLIRFAAKDSKSFNYTFRNNQSDFANIANKIQSIYVTQEKIFSLTKIQSINYDITAEEFKNATSQVLELEVLGVKLSFHNPFMIENYTLIPLILVRISSDLSLEVIQSLINRTITDNRTFNLPLLYCCQGKILMDRGEIEIGFSSLSKGISLFEGIRNTVSSDRLGIGFGDGYLKFYDWAIDAAIQTGNIHQAFDYSEHAKARATLDLLCQRTSSSASGVLQKSLLELQNLDLAIAVVDASTYAKPSHPNLLTSNFQNISRSRFYSRKKHRIQDLYKKRNSIIQKIDKIDPVASSLIIFKPLSWTKQSNSEDYTSTYSELWTNHSITDNEAIISYHGLCDARSIRGREWNRIVCFSLFVEDEKLRLNYYVVDDSLAVYQLQKTCQGLIKEIYSQSSQFNLSLISIAQSLIQPMLEDLPARLEKLVIMGNDEFQFMPWSTMYIGDDKDSMESLWLVDDFNIRVTPSLSLLFLLKQREDRRDPNIHPRFSVAGVSRYPDTQRFLYWAGFEIDSVAKLHNTEPIKDQAIDSHFVDKFQSSEIIHFAGHANYQVDESFNALDRSYLCLYHQNLSAAQILDGALQSSTAKAMILSACLTGRGDLIGAGSEILGLERSLFYAGLSALITTLWHVDDVATSILMIKFYSIWKQHNNSLDRLSSSLADAQVWLKNATWQDIKYEIEDFEDAIEACIEACSNLIKDELSKNEEADISSLRKSIKYCIKMKQYNENRTPFQHPYYWAAFQVKGVG